MNVETWMPVILLVVTTALTGVGGVIAAILKQKFNLDLEKQDREALHSAILTGVESAISKEKSIKEATVETVEAVKPVIIKEAIEYAQKSVPDAIKRLNPTAGIFADLALSKLEQIIQGKIAIR